jgi:hypothetical protein
MNTPSLVMDRHQLYALFVLGAIIASIDRFERHQRWYTPRLVLQWITNPEFRPEETLDRLVLFLRRMPHAPQTVRASAVLQSALDLCREPRLHGRNVLREVQSSGDEWVSLAGGVGAAAVMDE